jgi:hypothetical protein
MRSQSTRAPSAEGRAGRHLLDFGEPVASIAADLVAASDEQRRRSCSRRPDARIATGSSSRRRDGGPLARCPTSRTPTSGRQRQRGSCCRPRADYCCGTEVVPLVVEISVTAVLSVMVTQADAGCSQQWCRCHAWRPAPVLAHRSGPGGRRETAIALRMCCRGIADCRPASIASEPSKPASQEAICGPR